MKYQSRLSNVNNNLGTHVYTDNPESQISNVGLFTNQSVLSRQLINRSDERFREISSPILNDAYRSSFDIFKVIDGQRSVEENMCI